MACIDFITKLHKSTSRNYIERFTLHNKSECAQIAKQFGKDYWDGDRKYGYGGYAYDGRWKTIAGKIIKHYGLKESAKILDAGCGKGFLVYELSKLLPAAEIVGIDISEYAVKNAKKEIHNNIILASITDMPFNDNSFDLVLSLNTLHSLYVYEFKKALQEIERVSSQNSYIVVESYRNEQEKANLLCWQLTCECFYTPQEWEWLFNEFRYSGDHSFIFFE